MRSSQRNMSHSSYPLTDRYRHLTRIPNTFAYWDEASRVYENNSDTATECTWHDTLLQGLHACGIHADRVQKVASWTDEQLQEQIKKLLQLSDTIHIRELDVQVTDGIVLLHGAVAYRHEKREVEAIVEGVPGVEDVINQLRIEMSQRFRS